MNRSIVRFLISKLLLIEAGLLVVPLIVALIYQEDAKVFTSILGTMAILLFIGVLGTLFKPKNYRIYTKEGMLIVGYFGPSLGDYRLFLPGKSQVSSMPSSK